MAWMDNLGQDVRPAVRSLAKRPGFTAVALTTLALGIGVNTTVFSTVNALLVGALPFPGSERLVALSQSGANPVAPANFVAWREEVDVFEEMAASAWLNATLAGEGAAERLQGYRVTADFFRTLDIDAALGRTFVPGEDEPGRNQVVVLSHGLWEERFGADPGLVGRTIRLDGEAHTVVGIMPPRRAFPPGAELWTPLTYDPASQGAFMEVIARLRPEASVEGARAAMDALTRRLEERSPDTRTGVGVEVRTLAAYQTQYVRPLLLLLLTAVGFVLLIACANIANLLLARATSRTREIAVRRALGAGRGRIVRQLLTESVFLALVGGALGLLVAIAGVELIRSATPADTARLVAGWDRLGVDLHVLGFTFGVALFAGIAFGLAPAIGGARLDPVGALTAGARGVAGEGGGTRKGLVVAQVALALVLLVGAGLMTRSFAGLLRADPGFDAEDVLTMQLILPRSEYTEDREAVAFYDELTERVRSLPGVRSAGTVSYLPLSGTGGGRNYEVQGRPPPPSGERPFAQYRRISPDYPETMAIPLLRGRTFTQADDVEARRVALVDRSLAARHWPDGDALGARLELGDDSLEIVGVVGDVHHWGPAREHRPTIYVPQRQDPTALTFLTVRAASDPADLLAAVRREVGALDPDVAVAEAKTMERVVVDFHAAERLMAGMLGTFAIIALVISAVGIYGVIAYSVARRTHEIGVRVALGADPHRVLGMVVRQGLTLTVVGLGVGLAAALVLTRFMASLLYGVSPTDPATLAGVAALLGAVALLAAWVPGRSATRVDPMVALRDE